MPSLSCVRPLALSALLAAAILAAMPDIGAGAARAADAAETYAGSPVVARDDLRAMRGGLEIAGMSIQFGATVNTLVNGALAAQTVLTLNNDGTMGQQTTFLDGSVLSPVSGAQLSAITNGKIDPTSLKGAQGFTVNDVPGLTAALSDITLQHADNVVINTSPGINIQQLVNMQLTIQNFGQLDAALHAAMLAGRIAQIGQINPILNMH
ncbi:MAG TPA: hypothetical protein VMQ73_08190 [Methylomirabilota bacterium]|nr:hypothetical protein [Methylomirabilota bacterium]